MVDRQQKCDDLFDALCDRFAEEMQAEKVSPKLLEQVRQFLKDNNIKASTSHPGMGAIHALNGEQPPAYEDEGYEGIA